MPTSLELADDGAAGPASRCGQPGIDDECRAAICDDAPGTLSPRASRNGTCRPPRRRFASRRRVQRTARVGNRHAEGCGVGRSATRSARPPWSAHAGAAGVPRRTMGSSRTGGGGWKEDVACRGGGRGRGVAPRPPIPRRGMKKSPGCLGAPAGRARLPPLPAGDLAAQLLCDGRLDILEYGEHLLAVVL